MAFVGEAAVSKLLDLLLGKSIDAALNFVADHRKVYGQLKEWKSILPHIKSVLNDAEDKQITDEDVKNWLEDLQDLTYDAEDMLDEFAYEELRLKLHKTQAQASTSKVSRFPGLRELSISKCPQLSGRLPTRLQFLRRLDINGCTRLVVSISSFPSLSELTVDGCEELADGFSSSPVEEVTSLQSVCLSNIPKFSIPTERTMLRFANSKYFRTRDFNMLPKVSHAFTFLTRMILMNCEGMVSLGQSNLPHALKELRIYLCQSLQYLFDEVMSSNTCLLEYLEITGCHSLTWLSSRAATCDRLQNLEIWGCPKLSSLFLNARLPVMLKKLHIGECPMLECIAQDFDETTNLEVIKIGGAQDIKSLPRGLDKLSHLQEISLTKCPNLTVCFEEIGMPTTNLREFSIDCKKLGGLPNCINNFTSLRELIVDNCGADISFPEEGFPTSLTSLGISGASEIYSSLVEWGIFRLTSLQQLSIGCLDVVSFPEESLGLPPSLTSIGIVNFENLEFLCSKISSRGNWIESKALEPQVLFSRKAMKIFNSSSFE
ncbi:hypothetical protein V6N11_068624 [Hibiscus sabdariffa]|uniref:Disease resistance N-terminal domain-containing protein n=1 Tax=Hibiscus sabdariffa TaxID=183260 RepID=A0ABR2PAB7_9ROSI